MKRIYAFLMTLVLLTVGAINVCAQTINGKSESAYWKKSMTYTFLGGRVKDGVVDGINTKDEYLYEVIEGATLRFECEDVGKKEEMQVIVYNSWYWDRSPLSIEKRVHGTGSTQLTYKVPEGRDHFYVRLGFTYAQNILIRCRIVKRAEATKSGTNTDKQSGTITQHSEKIGNENEEMEYSFSGGTITKLGNVSKSSREYYKRTQDIYAEAKPGTTINGQVARIKGNQNANPKGKGPIYITIVAYKGSEKIYSNSKDSKTDCSMSYTIPNGATKVILTMSYVPYYPKSFKDYSLTCSVNYKVTDGTDTSQKQPDAKAESYSGSFERHGGKMEYSFSGCKVTKKTDNMVDRNDFYSCNQNACAIESYITGNVKPGATINTALRKVKGNTTLDSVLIRYYAYNDNPNSDVEKNYKGARTLSKSFQVPTNATNVVVKMEYAYMDATYVVSLHLEVTKTLPEVKSDQFKWDIVAYDDRCEHCKGQWSEYRIMNVLGGMSNLDFATCCNSEKKMRKNEEIFSCNNFFSRNFYYNDHIETLGGMEDRLILYKGEYYSKQPYNYSKLYGDEVLIFRGNTHAHLVKRLDNGSDRWNFYKGFVVGKHLKHTGKPAASFEMNKLIVHPNGTIYILQDDGQTSQAFLLQGSMDVTLKSNNKTVTLKPGQVATAGSDGKMKIQQFDVLKTAKKYDIPEDEIKGKTTTTTTTTTKQPTTTTKPTTKRPKNGSGTAVVKRYEVEHAIVKYKVTGGNSEGVLGKAFSNYGHLERRELKMGGQTTLQLVQGNTTYKLNTNHKTYTTTSNAELNFLNMNSSTMKQRNLQKKGTATVLGKECTVYSGNNVEYCVWKGIVLKKVQRTSNGIVTTIATNIDLSTSVDANMFKMPTGYRQSSQ